MMNRFFRRIGVTFKKGPSSAQERDRPDISRHRKRWRTYQGFIDPRRLVFIHETWTKTNMTRLRGWAPTGDGSSTRSRRASGRSRLSSPPCETTASKRCLFDGPINGERFHAYIEQFLVPTLKRGGVVILDNLGSHKGKAVRKAIRDVGARLVFLPKYSPDLNPIGLRQVQNAAAKGGSANLRGDLRRLR
jgi:hypothetical protein